MRGERESGCAFGQVQKSYAAPIWMTYKQAQEFKARVRKGEQGSLIVYSWQRLRELRRQQLEAWKAAQPQQPALFVLKDDFRPVTQRTAVRRFQEPTLFANVVAPSEG